MPLRTAVGSVAPLNERMEGYLGLSDLVMNALNRNV
jgi:hypothetical protein